MLFAGLGQSVLGKTVPSVLNTALKTKGTVFPNTDRPRPANNVFIFFSVEYFVSSFCAERVRLTIRKQEIIGIGIHNCLFLRSLFTFYILCRGKKLLEKTRKLEN